jgi:hypothetical protein
VAYKVAGTVLETVTKVASRQMTGWDSVVLNEPRMYGARLRYRFGK